jgi:hypothetical protein
MWFKKEKREKFKKKTKKKIINNIQTDIINFVPANVNFALLFTKLNGTRRTKKPSPNLII